MYSLTEAGPDYENKKTSVAIHRVARKEKLASHMSEVCKKKIDAYQAKVSKSQNCNDIKSNVSSIKKKGPKPKNGCRTGKLKRIRETFLKHIPNIHRKPRLSSDLKVIDDVSNTEETESVDENQLPWDAVIKSDEVASWSYDSSLKDPLALPETEDPWNFLNKTEHEKPHVIEDTISDYVKSSPMNAASIIEHGSDGEGIEWDMVDPVLKKQEIKHKKKYCIHCSYSSKSLLKLRNHMKRQHLRNSLKLTHSDIHLNKEGKETYFGFCFHCSFSTVDRFVLKNHTLIYHKNSTPLKCSKCNFSSFFSEELCLHLMSVHTEPRKSKKLNFFSQGKKKLQKNVNPGVPVDIINDSDSTEVLKKKNFFSIEENKIDTLCNTNRLKCDKTLIQEEILDKHNGKSATVFCPYCSFSTNGAHEIINHLSNEHNSKYPTSKLYLPADDLDQNKSVSTHSKFKGPNLKDLSHLHKHESNFRCPVCPFKTVLRLHLEQHIMVSHTRKEPSGTFCLHCSFMGDKVQTVIEHIKNKHEMIHSLKSMCECPYCFYISNDTKDYIHHLAFKHTSKVPVKCNYCELTALDYFQLAKHISVERKRRQQFYCHLCHFSSNCSQKYTKHFLTQHKRCKKRIKSNEIGLNQEKLEPQNQAVQEVSNNLDSSDLIFDPKDFFKCNVCPFKTRLRLHLFQHIMVLHTRKESKQSVCLLCGFCSIQAKTVVEHIKEGHEIIDSSEPVRECLYCYYTSCDHNDYIHHLATNHASKVPVRCGLCEFLASDLNQLAHHMASERDKRQEFYCHICHFSSNLPKQFIIHFLKPHKKKYVPSCSFCSYRTCELQDLINHMEMYHSNVLELPKDSRNNFNEIKIRESPNNASNTKQVDFSNKDQRYEINQEAPEAMDVSNTSDLQGLNLLSNPVFECCLICDKCNLVASNTEELQRHIISEHKGTTVTFQSDFSVFNEGINLYKYLKIGRKGEIYFCCPHCGHFSEQIEELEHHLKSKHKQEEMFSCPHCSLTFNDLDDLSKHSLTKHNFQFSFSCSFCNYKTLQANEYKEHLHSEHKKNNVSSITPENQLDIVKEKRKSENKCLYCSYSTCNIKELSFHFKTSHKNLAIHFCYYCEFYCALFSELEEHVKEKHGSQKMLTCAQCDFTSDSRQIFSEHLSLKHGIEIKFQCAHCSYKATDCQILQEHMINDHKEQINIINTGDKKISFTCSHCTNSFSDVDELQEHITEVHIDKIVFCPCCTYSTSKKPNLQFHITSVHKNGLNVCSCIICDYSCNDYSLLQNHMKNYHNKNRSDKNVTREKQVPLPQTANDSISQTDDTIPQTDDTISQTNDTIPQTDDTISQTYDTISQTNDTISQNNDTISQTNNTISQTNDTIPHTNDTISQNNDTISQTNDTISIKDPKIPAVELIFSCSFCDFSTDSPSLLSEHEDGHVGNRDSSSQVSNANCIKDCSENEILIQFCSFCDFGTDDSQELNLHLKKEHRKCSVSPSTMNNKSLLDVQNQKLLVRTKKLPEKKPERCENTKSVEKGSKTFSCSINDCNFKTVLWSDLKAHAKIHLDNPKPNFCKPLKSIIVKRKTNTKKTREKSGVAVNVLSKEITNTSNSDSRGPIFTSNTRLSSIQKNVSKTLPKVPQYEFSCRQCSFKTSNGKDFQQHLLRCKLLETNKKIVPVHSKSGIHMIDNEEYIFLYSCDHCDYTTKFADNLQHHIFTQHTSKCIRCSLCTSYFTNKNLYNQHLFTEHKLLPLSSKPTKLV